MARGVAYLVFLIPIIVSVPIAAYVLYDVVSQPGRELGMMPGSAGTALSSPVIDFVGIDSSYSVNDPLDIKARISDAGFDCGDVYITVYDSADNAVSQSAFFDQCFSKNRSIVPVGEQFSDYVAEAGRYQVVLDILDKSQEHTESASVVINVT